MKTKKSWILAIAILPLAFVALAVNQTSILPILKTPDFSKLTALPVVRIVDGDTIIVRDTDKDIKVRLIGIDTPETVHPSKPVEYYGKEASRFTDNLLKGEKVYLVNDPEGDKIDKYGRTLAHVYRVPDGLFVNAEIIRQGYGHAYTRFPFKYMEEFKQLERFARKAEKGLWAPIPAVKKPTSKELVTVSRLVKPMQEAQPKLPPHKFAQPRRYGRTRAQIRAVMPLQMHTKQELMEIAVQLAKIHAPESAAFLVQFFDDSFCLENWDGTGLLRDSDWPHWLCRITIDTNPEGELYARTFELALTEDTGSPRTDVLREE